VSGWRKQPHPDPTALAAWVPKLARVPALVWGDFVLDEYWRCRTSRVSREAPVLVLEWEGREIQFGGAANAALNLAALGAKVAAAGWVGDDPAGRELRHALAAAAIDTAGLIAVPGAHTIVKVRVTAGGAHTARQQVVRIDRGAPFVPGRASLDRLERALNARGRAARAVVLSDYGYDSVTPKRAASRVAAWTSGGAVVALDSRYRLAAFRGVTIATPNESEAAAAVGRDVIAPRELAPTAQRLRRELAAPHLLVTRGRDGLTLWSEDGGVGWDAWGGHEAVDVTGAGDAVVAATALALAAGAPPETAAALANVAGSIAVSRRGAIAVTARDLRRALDAAARTPTSRGRTKAARR
jgi:rfaE bifunctional protein kinase chain/domain